MARLLLLLPVLLLLGCAGAPGIFPTPAAVKAVPVVRIAVTAGAADYSITLEDQVVPSIVSWTFGVPVDGPLRPRLGATPEGWDCTHTTTTYTLDERTTLSGWDVSCVVPSEAPRTQVAMGTQYFEGQGSVYFTTLAMYDEFGSEIVYCDTTTTRGCAVPREPVLVTALPAAEETARPNPTPD